MKLKLSISILFIIINLSAYAQSDWSKLSANQKIKLAKKEQKEQQRAKKNKKEQICAATGGAALRRTSLLSFALRWMGSGR